MDESTIDNRLILLNCILQELSVCIELKYINKIVPLPFLEPVPLSQNYLVGLMNYAGESIPVIDLAMCLGKKRMNCYSLDMSIVLCCDDKQKMGFLVDKVEGLAEINVAMLQMQEDFFEKKSPFLAVAPINIKRSLLLNVPYVMAMSDNSKLSWKN